MGNVVKLTKKVYNKNSGDGILPNLVSKEKEVFYELF